MKCCDYDLWCPKFVYPFRRHPHPNLRDPLISITKRHLAPIYIKHLCIFYRYLESGKAKLWATPWSKYKRAVHFHSKFVQNGWWVELRQKIWPIWAQNASRLHFIHYCLYKMTYISVRFCKNLKKYSTAENKYFVRLQISISFWSRTCNASKGKWNIAPV
jgi:hypothetical protein